MRAPQFGWQHGVSLVEVLAGSALLATLLVALLMAHGRAIRQEDRAQQRLVACQVADRLLTQWMSDPNRHYAPPPSGEGEIAGSPGWKWKTTTEANRGIEDLGGTVVALEVLAPAHMAGTNQPAVRVEIPVPADPNQRDPELRFPNHASQGRNQRQLVGHNDSPRWPR